MTTERSQFGAVERDRNADETDDKNRDGLGIWRNFGWHPVMYRLTPITVIHVKAYMAQMEKSTSLSLRDQYSLYIKIRICPFA
jgi:hypothetical protein